MDIALAIKAIIMGLVEGFTEFLPISSTGHLILAGELLNFTGVRETVFKIVIQLGAVLAVVWEYRERVTRLFSGLGSDPIQQRFARNVAIAFMPAAVAGVLFSATITELLFHPVPVAIALVVGGVIILWVEHRQRQRMAPPRVETVDQMTALDALKVGFAQSFALIPGTSRSGSTIIGGMLIVNLNYWGCNQYIIQRALGADLHTARKGLLFAAFLKLLMPIIVVLPGIAAYALDRSGTLGDAMRPNGELNPDRAYPTLLALLPAGIKGLAFAALTAAVVASLAGKANSIATIFTLDIYNKHFNREASEQRMVWIGRVSVVVSMAIAVLLAPLMGIDKKGGFQYIQEYTGFVSPGILAMFLLGFYWRKTTAAAAMFATIGGLVFSVFLKFLPLAMDLSFLAPIGFAVDNGAGVYEIPFLDRMLIVFIMVVIGMVVMSKMAEQDGTLKRMHIDRSLFRVDGGFALGSAVICVLLVAIYGLGW